MSSDGRRLAIERLRVRAEMRSAGDVEDSTVIEQEAQSRAPKKADSTPAPARGIVAVLNTLPPWGRVIFLLAVVVALVSSGLTWATLSGWLKP